MLVDVQREGVVGALAVVAVHSGGHPLRQDVLADPLQLVLRAVLHVQECLQADLLALRDEIF